MHLPKRVTLVEVGPRDGLQNEPGRLATATKVEWIGRLATAGLPVIEAGSFVAPERVPQMADTALVFAALPRPRAARLVALTLNRRGLDQALAAGVDQVAVVAAASDAFARANTNGSVEDLLARYREIVGQAVAHRIAVRGYVSCALGCPYEGAVAPERVAAVAQALFAMGCAEISLGDTIGTGTPGQARAMVAAVARLVPVERLAAHFHDTYGQALANLLAVLDQGVAIIDAATAGLGGCPYAKGASGNVATEDVLYMLDGLGIATGVTLDAVVDAGAFICEALGRPPASKAALALRARRPTRAGAQ